jgi:hypothetical protein
MDGFNRDSALRPGGAPWPDAAKADAGPRRNRDSLFLLARVRIGSDERWTDVRVRNLSPGGLMAEIETALAIDTPVELELRGVGQVTGRVAWQAEGRTGIAFDAEIDPMKARKPVGRAAGARTAVQLRR